MNRLLSLLIVVSALLWGSPVQAHKASDGYLLLSITSGRATLRVDIALRDLDQALDLDADLDGRITWGEIRAAWPSMERYITDRVAVSECDLRPTGRSLERRNDGAYAALTLDGPCWATGSVPAIRYALLREIDPTHRGIARVEREGAPPILQVLDPTEAAGQGTSSGSPASASTAGADRGRTVTSALFGEGIGHIVHGYDHLLFLLCLMLPSVMQRRREGWQPLPRWRDAVLPLAGVVTAFTVAHSLTLALATLKVVTIPSRIIEPAIAVTIVLAAIDNIRPIFGGRRGTVTFLFGLVHGFGFAAVLSELNLPAATFASALFTFNLGIEAGQLSIVLCVSSLLYLVRSLPGYPLWAIRSGSIAAILMGALWFVERVADVSLLPF